MQSQVVESDLKHLYNYIRGGRNGKPRLKKS